MQGFTLGLVAGPGSCRVLGLDVPPLPRGPTAEVWLVRKQLQPEGLDVFVCVTMCVWVCVCVRERDRELKQYLQ